MVRVGLVFALGVVGISLSAIFVRLALPAPPVVAAFYRVFFAALLVGAGFAATGRSLGLDRRGLLLSLAAGACFATDLGLWYTAVVHTSVATATLLVNTTPVLVGLWSLLVLREPLRPRFAAGAGLALLGSAILAGLPSGPGDHALGALLALAAALFYAGYLLLIKAARAAGDALGALFAMTSSAACVLGAFALATGETFRGYPPGAWAAMAAGAVVSQCIGVMGIVWALRYLPATLASVALLGQPIGTALFGWIVLGEAMGTLQLAGAAAVLAGIALASRARPAGARPDPASGSCTRRRRGAGGGEIKRSRIAR